MPTWATSSRTGHSLRAYVTASTRRLSSSTSKRKANKDFTVNRSKQHGEGNIWSGLLLGCGSSIQADQGRRVHFGGLQRGRAQEPHVSRCLQRPHRACRGGRGGLRP